MKSSRIVLTTGGSLGDLHPYLAIGLGLKSRGHRVAIATLPFYRKRVEGTGLDFLPVGPELSPEDPELVRLAADVKSGSENIFRRFIIPYLRPGYEDMLRAIAGADLLLTHPTTIAAPLAAEKAGIRWASAVLAPISLLSVHEPVDFPGHPVMSALTRLGTGPRRVIAGMGRWMTRRWVRPLEALRAELGLPPGGHPLFEGQHSPRLSLALFSKVIGAPQPDWPPNTVQTGFCVHDGGGTLAADLDRFLEGDAPLVFALGSSAIHVPGTFWEESVAAARAVGKRAVLVGAPATLAAPDVFAADYVPYSLLFSRAAATVTSGGIGTIAQALRGGHPMIVVPYGNDQPDNAARATRLGVARTIPRATYTNTRAAREIEALLGEPSYARRAEEVAKTVVAEDGVRVACDALERLL